MESTNMETDVNTKHQGDEPEDPFAFIDEPLVGADDVEINPALKDVAYEDVGDALQVQIKDEITESELEDEIVQDVFIKEEPVIDLDEDMDNVINSAEIKDSPAKDSNKGKNSDQQTQNSSSNTAQTSSNLDMYTTDTGTRIFFPKDSCSDDFQPSLLSDGIQTDYSSNEIQPKSSKKKYIKSETPEISTESSSSKDSKPISKSTRRRRLLKDKFKCDQCNFTAPHKYRFDFHMARHTGIRNFPCELCNYRAAQKSCLNAHMKLHQIEYLNCKYCEYKTKSKTRLQAHQEKHEENVYACGLCDYKAKTTFALFKKHVKSHTLVKYHCEECDYTTAHAYTYHQHVKIHSGGKERRFQCPLCDYAAFTRCILKQHMMTHTKDKNFHCTLCDYKASLKGNLTRHMNVHTGEKKYACTICDYRAAQKGTLDVHMRGHDKNSSDDGRRSEVKNAKKDKPNEHIITLEGKKYYKCDQCDYKGTFPGNLKRHKDVVHGGERNFYCGICDYRAGQKVSLDAHMKKHRKDQI